MNKGIILILLGYVGWGLFPLYWALVKHVPAFEVLSHRMLWSVPVLILFVVLITSWRSDFFSTLKNKRELGWLLLTSTLITINWGVYVYAVNNDRVVEASMGYFLSPLLHVLGGLVIFKEQLGPLRKLAVTFATLGVLYYIFSVEVFPWIGLVVGFSFAAYGILRKFIKTSAVPGLLVETLLLVPLSLGYLVYIEISGEAVFLNLDLNTDIFLGLAGIVTVVPLVLFTAGARLLPMTTSGILFYITPTMQFLIGAFIFKETVNTDQLIGFSGIWIGLALYTFSLLSRQAKIEPSRESA
ncbi:EamA family transporter RarD [Cocleimonas sp. KMM 6892]|uniref:EamA family transporter RarD n=1 Tax=unclassified Cocleimonas TaxID=2639732 RepID=UPI002DBD5883|nr:MULTISPECIES: EamA family transporter RarD [unclassified Cocleimonas]MEB8431523.1 EamA family transporter RarD [Cocleimonas sp. KMM 6892]MEC4713705.1 EamA family transporter RarD [Cocleimonas sp. KMM 6895]MEC4743036.1 EamA family transporter RarD [Cocleimonas sp. KMM 6896]